MNQQAKVARFVSRLTSPLKECLQAFRLTTFADILDTGKPIEQELINAKKKNLANNPTNIQPKKEFPKKRTNPNPGPNTTYLPLALCNKAREERLCYSCFNPGHISKNFPKLNPTQNQPTQEGNMKPQN